MVIQGVPMIVTLISREMKRTSFLLICMLVLFASWREIPVRNLPGRYTGGFAGDIRLYSDSTFLYQWRFDLMYSWSRGTWTATKDTVWLNILPVYDTLTLNVHNGGPVKDSLLLSNDTLAERITGLVLYAGNTSAQGSHLPPPRLICLKDRLYLPDAKGKPDKKAHYKFGNRKYPAYYQREGSIAGKQ